MSAAEPVPSLFERNEILPEDPDLEVLHDREYRVRAFRKDPNLLIRGAVRDQKPPDLYFAGDPRPLTIHHMQVELEIAFPSLEIVGAAVHFETHPQATCPVVATHYEKLIGLSIARGFTHKVRELFGGPRGCSHTTALLQAMAPVAVQCFWSMSASEAKRRSAERAKSAPDIDFVPKAMTKAERDAQWQMNLNTCHVWAEDGDFVDAIRHGAALDPPLFAMARMDELGMDHAEWYRSMRG
ncbi:MAG: hypothetical protein JWM34_5275 [Ilumatobacteraceae bacterium]|nr:hypothetical protein [Ilumatobacteraceae bacterium]